MASDIEATYGKQFQWTMRGVAAEVDGQLVGISGILHSQPLQLFSNLDQQIRKHPKLFVKAARELKKIMALYDAPILAKADNTVESSGRYLEYLGFTHAQDNIYVK